MLPAVSVCVGVMCLHDEDAWYGERLLSRHVRLPLPREFLACNDAARRQAQSFSFGRDDNVHTKTMRLQWTLLALTLLYSHGIIWTR